MAQTNSKSALPALGYSLGLAPKTSTGIAHELTLLEKPPELVFRIKSLLRLIAQYD